MLPNSTAVQLALARAIRKSAAAHPGSVPLLKGAARWIAFTNIEGDPVFKSYDYFLSNVERLIRSVYEGNLGGEFIDVMANLISGQINQAYRQAWEDEGTEEAMPGYLLDAADSLILAQYDHVDQLYHDTVDARVDETPIEPLLARAPMWAQRWTEAYNQGLHLITLNNGGKERWELGDTEQHCRTCRELDGIVAYAREWDDLNVHPQHAPNENLECGGWQCDCRRAPTDARRTRNAVDRISGIIS